MSDESKVKQQDIHATSEPVQAAEAALITGANGEATTQGDIHATTEPVDETIETKDIHATSEPFKPVR
ncbi:hypothetical protein [Streptomyces griseoruber]|uniref:Uncharacterized protein n=1 Tax=Streptomyces griseoruber TaxID=1943 RepID=A0A101SU64_9ACTN|nr:hypothetical protein [Streptomyces griseoruber]KUN80106.1 hypothetical protein AQJ64_27245 [Streptomyces griseoruber]